VSRWDRAARWVRPAVYSGLAAALGLALMARGRWERTRQAQEHARLGMQYFREGNLPAAADELRQEIALSPKPALAYYKLGVVELQRGRYQPAIAALSHARALHVEHPQAPCALGTAAFRLASYSAAVAPLQECIARNPQDDEARYLLAAAYMGQARLDEAERGFRELVERQPRNSRFLYALGALYLARPATPANNAAALAALRRAVAFGGAPPGAFYSLGLVCRRAGRWQEAATALEKAVHGDPQMLEARRSLGLVYRRLGREKEASEQFRQARGRWASTRGGARDSAARPTRRCTFNWAAFTKSGRTT
jgi:tetratricopeptide (TPR) repeat protein